MLIESLIKPVPPKAVRNITLFGTPYVFKAVLPGRYVATVTEPKHAETFLANPAYAEFTETLPSATLVRGAPAAAAPPLPAAGLGKEALPEVEAEEDEIEDAEPAEEGADEDLGAGGASDDPGEWPTAIADEAAALLRNAPARLAIAIGRVTSADVLRCALALERHRSGRQKPRADVVELIEGTLRDIAAAGG